MKNSTSTSNFWLATALIIASLIFRIVSNQLAFFNFTPVIAVALFAGAKFKDNKWAFLIPIITLFISDAVLAYLNNFSLLHETILFTYGSLMLIIALGKVLQKDKLNVPKIAGLSILSSALFFILTNFGVWAFGNMYTHDIDGLIKCYVLAIPFNKVSWMGDMVFSLALFGAYEWMQAPSTNITKAFVSHKNDQQ